MKNILIVLGVGAVIVLLTQFLTPYGGMHMMHNFYNYNNIVVYLLAAVIVIIVVLFIFESKNSKTNSNKILDNRLASGEISIEEYERVKRAIGGSKS